MARPAGLLGRADRRWSARGPRALGHRLGHTGVVARRKQAANGYAEHSPGNYTLAAVIVAEILLTAFFLIVVLGATDVRAPKGMGALAIGLALTLIHLISIPISNTSVNPARSTGVAFFNGNGAPGQLWVFWVAPLVGGIIGGLLYPLLFEDGRFKFAPVQNTV